MRAATSRRWPREAVRSPRGRAARLDLAAIRVTLEELGRASASIERRLGTRRDPTDHALRRRMLAAYARLDRECAAGHDLLSPGHSRTLLALNHILLYGPDGRRERRHARAIDASERRFYDGDESATAAGVVAGVGDLVAWRDAHRRLPTTERAAGVYLRTLATPQLFVEGNHRTATLLASHELVRDERPPLVLSTRNAEALFACSPEIGRLARGSLSMWIRSRALRRRVADVIESSADPAHLTTSSRARSDADPTNA